MFETTAENIESGYVTRYTIQRDGTTITFSDVLDLWQHDPAFRDYYTHILATSEFSAYRWETPALMTSTVSQPFQFVLLNCPAFCSRNTDQVTFQRYFTDDETDSGVISFTNLGGDATLVVPSPRTNKNAYGHLAAFIRNAPQMQLDAFWRIVSNSVKTQLSSKPLWLSTAGGGVAWLHVRIDSRPKYYGYSPYKTA